MGFAKKFKFHIIKVMVRLLATLINHKFSSLNQVHFFSNAITKRGTQNLNKPSKMFKSSVYNLQEASKDQVQQFLNSFDTVLSDCDGEFFNCYFLCVIYNVPIKLLKLLHSFQVFCG